MIPAAFTEAILNHLKPTALEKMETDPAYYRDFSQMIEDTLKAIEQERMTELEALEQAQSLRQQADFRRYSLDFPPRQYISND